MSKAADIIAAPLFTNANLRINLSVYSDVIRKTRTSISGKTVRVVISDPGGSTFGYNATAISASRGTAYITLTGSNHTTTGTAPIQVHIDGIPKQRYSAEFVAKL